jgi:hypothetical protein
MTEIHSVTVEFASNGEYTDEEVAEMVREAVEGGDFEAVEVLESMSKSEGF